MVELIAAVVERWQWSGGGGAARREGGWTR